jgi:hypothetical protein
MSILEPVMHTIITKSGKTFSIDEIIVVDDIEHRCIEIKWSIPKGTYTYEFSRWDS